MTVRKKRTPKASSPAIPSVSFDDALALLIQLEPGNMEGFQQLAEALRAVSASGSLDASIVKLIDEAGAQIDRLVQGETTDVEEVLIEVSRLLEIASSARDAVALETTVLEPSNPEKTGEIAKMKVPVASPVIAATPAPPAQAEAPVPAEEAPAPEALPFDADPDLLKEFIAESRELLEKSEAALLALENSPDDAESVNTVFRAFHTVKGTSGFLGLKSISELAHHAESLLSRIRNKEIHLVGGYADLSLRSLDMLKKAVVSVEDALRGAPLAIPEGYAELQAVLANPEAAGISEELSTELPVSSEEPELLPESAVECEPVRQEPALEQAPATPANVSDPKDAPKKQVIPQREGEVEASIRVNTARLDKLINMVGELVIAQSMVAQDQHLLEESCHDLLRKVTQAGKIVRELQDLSMSMRMVPLRGVFQKMQRVARDLSRKSGKSVDLVTDDGDAEIDRHMVDILNDVLVHMVRNAIDHGIEPQEEREAGGKSRTGTVRLAAFHSGGTVVVEIRDDGRGLNREKILRKAIASGLVDAEKSLSDSEIYNLIFAPGLSTAEKISDVSGRGVGMDVVRQGVESLHGRIDITTAPGVGSTFTVRLPLTLAITDGMLVRVGTERYIIPTISIHLCFRPTRDSLSTVAGRGELVMLRGKLMPIFRLHRLFGIHSALEDPAQALLVVVGDEDRRCALLVDELLGQQQVVAKSLSRAVGKIPGVSGGAILGDGQVGLILDTAEVTAQARKVPGMYRSPGLANSSAA
jgi:two-component system, chemotaxis family, sensor kinase CheA